MFGFDGAEWGAVGLHDVDSRTASRDTRVGRVEVKGLGFIVCENL